MAEGLDICYQHTVERINWGKDGATVHCSGGKAFACDAVICTVSLGILKVRAERPSPRHALCRQDNQPSGFTHLVILQQSCSFGAYSWRRRDIKDCFTRLCQSKSRRP